MPPTAAEVVRMVVEASNRQDMDAFVALFDEGAVIRSAWHRALAGDAVHRGHEGVRRWAAEAWETVNVRLDVDWLLPYGSLVLALGTIRTRGRSGGTRLEHEYGAVLQVRRGRVVLFDGHLDHGDALVAFGRHVKSGVGGEPGRLAPVAALETV